jgi:hypothetical protein
VDGTTSYVKDRHITSSYVRIGTGLHPLLGYIAVSVLVQLKGPEAIKKSPKNEGRFLL